MWKIECENGRTCTYNSPNYENIFLVKNGTHDLLRFNVSINLGRESIAGQMTLVDSEASANFISERLYQRIIESGGMFKKSTDGWMKVTAAGW
jgi:hypothetical protein